MYDSIFKLNKKLSFVLFFMKALFLSLLLRLTKILSLFFIQNKDIHKCINLSTSLWTTFFYRLLSSSYHPFIHKQTRCAKTLSTFFLNLCITNRNIILSIILMRHLSTKTILFLLLNKVIHHNFYPVYNFIYRSCIILIEKKLLVENFL